MGRIFDGFPKFHNINTYKLNNAIGPGHAVWHSLQEALAVVLWNMYYQYSHHLIVCWYLLHFSYLQCFDAVGWVSIWPVKNWVVGCWRGYANLHMAQLMPLPPTVSCSSKSRLVLPYWCWLTQVVPDKIQEVVYVCVYLLHFRRLDYCVISERLKDALCDSVIHSDTPGSDHCPVTALMCI